VSEMTKSLHKHYTTGDGLGQASERCIETLKYSQPASVATLTV